MKAALMPGGIHGDITARKYHGIRDEQCAEHDVAPGRFCASLITSSGLIFCARDADVDGSMQATSATLLRWRRRDTVSGSSACLVDTDFRFVVSAKMKLKWGRCHTWP